MDFTVLSVECGVMLGKLADHIIPSIIIVLVFWFVGRILGEEGVIAKRFLAGADRTTAATMGKVLFMTLRRAIAVIGGLTLAGEWGFDLKPMLASLGIVSMALALAAQDVVKNFLGAFTILVCNIFKIGDKISVGGVTGVVQAIDFRSTQILTDDGNRVYVPNASFSSSNVTIFKSPS